MASTALKDLSLKVLNSKIKDERIIQRVLEQYPNIEREQITQGFLFLLNMAKIINDDTAKASDRLKAYQILEATSGQKPIDKQEITNIDQDGYRRVLMGDEDIFAGDYGSADEGDEEEEDKKE